MTVLLVLCMWSWMVKVPHGNCDHWSDLVDTDGCVRCGSHGLLSHLAREIQEAEVAEREQWAAERLHENWDSNVCMTTREDVYLLFNMRTLRRSKTENQTRSFNNAIFILTTCFHSIPIRVTLSVCVCVESHCVLYPTVFYLCVLSRPFAICVTSIVTDAFTVYEY